MVAWKVTELIERVQARWFDRWGGFEWTMIIATIVWFAALTVVFLWLIAAGVHYAKGE